MSSFDERILSTMANKQEGYLELFLGSMFSGKTTEIIKKYNTYSYIGKKVIVINYADDTRYHDSMLSTHDKKMIPCVLSYDIHDIWYNITNKYYDEIHSSDVILINEGQFFKNIKDTIIDMVDNHNKIVYVCGLDGDFKREIFGELVYLIPFCDKVTKLHSLCANCKNGKRGIFSCRITTETNQVVIGSDNYKPLCRSCYNKYS
jgi:thymidine kinase